MKFRPAFAPLYHSIALKGVVAGALLGLSIFTNPARSITLVDNTNQGLSAPTTTFSFSNSTNRLAAINMSTGSKNADRLNLITNLTADPGTFSMRLRIFEVDNAASTPNLTNPSLFDNSYNLTATSDLPQNYSLRFDAPLLASKVYSFVFSSIAGTTSIGRMPSTSFSNGTPFSAGSSFTTINGTDWSPTSNAPYFYLQEVPGPLPILGAGSAFAWSRRLRRRVTAARELSGTCAVKSAGKA